MLRRFPVCLLILVFTLTTAALPQQPTPNPTPTPAQDKDTQLQDAQKKIEQLQESAKKPEPWDVEGNHGPTTPVEFDTDEGTWMSCDVSPDGQTIVFDLLGDSIQLSGSRETSV